MSYMIISNIWELLEWVVVTVTAAEDPDEGRTWVRVSEVYQHHTQHSALTRKKYYQNVSILIWRMIVEYGILAFRVGTRHFFLSTKSKINLWFMICILTHLIRHLTTCFFYIHSRVDGWKGSRSHKKQLKILFVKMMKFRFMSRGQSSHLEVAPKGKTRIYNFSSWIVKKKKGKRKFSVDFVRCCLEWN